MQQALVLAIPASSMIDGPLGSSLLELNGFLGLTGWRWMFILEGVPTVLLGFVVLAFLPDRPETAHFLAPEERG